LQILPNEPRASFDLAAIDNRNQFKEKRQSCALGITHNRALTVPDAARHSTKVFMFSVPIES
jgi:hypothetical protein